MKSGFTTSFPGLHPGYGDTMTDLNIVALVSVGAHPTSGRPRRAEQDARAVELGLRLAGQNLQLLHAGDPQAEALRGYLGMGLEQLDVLEQPEGADALPLLVDYLQGSRTQLVLTGSQAETGEGSGMLPFLLAERLGWPMVVGLAEVEKVENGVAQVLQALPRGQRRRLKVIKAKTGAERMKAATARASGGGGQVLKDVSPQEGAEAIFKLLIEEGVLR